VQHRAGQVEDWAQIGSPGLFGAAVNGGEQGCFVGQGQAVFQAFTGGGQFGANAAGD
jgi:hypothetical protein